MRRRRNQGNSRRTLLAILLLLRLLDQSSKRAAASYFHVIGVRPDGNHIQFWVIVQVPPYSGPVKNRCHLRGDRIQSITDAAVMPKLASRQNQLAGRRRYRTWLMGNCFGRPSAIIEICWVDNSAN